MGRQSELFAWVQREIMFERSKRYTYRESRQKTPKLLIRVEGKTEVSSYWKTRAWKSNLVHNKLNFRFFGVTKFQNSEKYW